MTAGLFGPEPGARPKWRVELVGIGASTSVRVALVDAETGARLGSALVPFEWMRDVAHNGTVTVDIVPGRWD